MSFLAGIIGSGAAIIVIAVMVMLLPHVGKAPNAAHPWLYRAAIVLNYGAGSLLAVGGIGTLWLSIVSRIADLFGGLGSGPAHVAIVLGSVIMILGLVLGLILAPAAEVAMAAAMTPFVLVLTSHGAIHTFWVDTSAPAQQFTQQFAAWLGG